MQMCRGFYLDSEMPPPPFKILSHVCLSWQAALKHEWTPTFLLGVFSVIIWVNVIPRKLPSSSRCRRYPFFFADASVLVLGNKSEACRIDHHCFCYFTLLSKFCRYLNKKTRPGPWHWLIITSIALKIYEKKTFALASSKQKTFG